MVTDDDVALYKREFSACVNLLMANDMRTVVTDVGREASKHALEKVVERKLRQLLADDLKPVLAKVIAEHLPRPAVQDAAWRVDAEGYAVFDLGQATGEVRGHWMKLSDAVIKLLFDRANEINCKGED